MRENRSRARAEKKKRIRPSMIILIAILFFILIISFSSIQDAFSNKLLVIPIKGTITNSNQATLFFIQEANVPSIIKCLEKAEKDPTVKAVLLDINSPGGTVVGTADIADKLQEVKAKKPVVSFIHEMGASGAYWIASVSNKIIAEPFSLTGSIGVTASYLEYGGLLSNLNITYERLVTGEYKDIASPYRELTERERDLLVEKIDIIHKEFLDLVAKNRGLTEQQKNQVGSSLFYLGKEALALGLVDELGNKEKAEKVAKELAKNEKLRIVTCERSEPLLPFLRSSANFAYFLGKGIGSELFSSKLPNPIIQAIS